MATHKHTKKALFASMISILLCVTMLVGSTFAWFTDTASTNVNTIQAGELDIMLMMDSGTKDEAGNIIWEDAKDQTLTFKTADNRTTDIYFEPNATYELPAVKIVNDGNLALKYKLLINGIPADANAKLAEVLDVWFKIGDGDGEWVKTAGTLATLAGSDIGAAQGILLPAEADLEKVIATDKDMAAVGETSVYTIALHMKETANNDYQNLTMSGISVTVEATQYTYEYDSTTNLYDALSKYPDGKKDENLTVQPGTVEDLNKAIATALEGGAVEGVITINLDKDFNVANSWKAPQGANYSGVNKVVINGNNHKITNLNESLLSGIFGGLEGSLEINNLTIADSNITGSNAWGVGAFLGAADSTNKVVFNNCHLNNVTVTGTGTTGGTGGFVGASSAQNVELNGCTTTKLTVNGDNSVGALFGLCQSNMTATNCTFTDTTLVSSKAGEWRVGLVGGTLNGSTTVVTITGATESGTTLTQTGATANAITDNTNGAVSVYFGRAFKTISMNGTDVNANAK